ncbi:hypothetical protein XELAEV_18009474mg [Xenopus laevis]|uniref:Uncharacterized protein n=1 Tax=Xenopus laevis TaxID=8355 RepID=A0A974I0V3_XENLA|nr:hypothetical protein XELAEV_18009474mg [Xenopus laevis]
MGPFISNCTTGSAVGGCICKTLQKSFRPSNLSPRGSQLCCKISFTTVNGFELHTQLITRLESHIILGDHNDPTHLGPNL